MFKMLIGRVPQENGHHISTEFMAFLGPLVPLRSIYVTQEAMSRSPGMTTYEAQGIDLPLQLVSVVLGYLRVWLAWAWVVSPFYFFWGESLDFGRPEWRWTMLLFSAWLAVMVLPGLFLRRGSEQRRMLAHATGVSVSPRQLDRFQREARLQGLAYDLDRAGLDVTDPGRVPEQAVGVDPALLSKLFAYCSYAAADDPAWAPVARRVFQITVERSVPDHHQSEA